VRYRAGFAPEHWNTPHCVRRMCDLPPGSAPIPLVPVPVPTPTPTPTQAPTTAQPGGASSSGAKGLAKLKRRLSAVTKQIEAALQSPNVTPAPAATAVAPPAAGGGEGTWQKKYQHSAFFFLWIEHSQPNCAHFVRDLNVYLTDNPWGANGDAVRALSGSPLDALGHAYDTWLQQNR
jgi:hypothetical protein